MKTIQAKNISLYDLETAFGLRLVEDDQFFREWQDDLPEVSAAEKQRLDQVKASYSHLLKYPPLLENTVKMVVLSPLLELAGFYLPPFHMRSEKSVEFTDEDEGVVVKGTIDILAIFDQFWAVVIESKKAAFSLEVGRAQLLAYLLANPQPENPVFGLITNGSSFIFIKLVQRDIPQYALSRLFYLFNPGNDLYVVLSVLKRLGQLAIKTPTH